MTFFVIFFTAYAVLLTSFLDSYLKNSTDNMNNFSCFVYNFCLLAITVCGFIVSILWIEMSKGSKLWVEKYEASIGFYIDSDILLSKNVININEKAKKDVVDKPDFYPAFFPSQGCLCEISDNTNDSIFSSQSGEYSVSRLNIGIGLFGLIIWGALFCFHLIVLINFKYINSAIVFSSCTFIISVILFLCSGYTYSRNNKRYIKKRIRQRLKIYNAISNKNSKLVEKLIHTYYQWDGKHIEKEESANAPNSSFDKLVKDASFVNVCFADTFDKYTIQYKNSSCLRLKAFCKKLFYLDSERLNTIQKGIGIYKLTKRIRDYEKLRHIDTLSYNYICALFKKLELNTDLKNKEKQKKQYSPVLVIFIVLIVATVCTLLFNIFIINSSTCGF